MKKSEIIGEIARASWNATWTFGELAAKLGLKSAWHAGQFVGLAWRYFARRGDCYTCSAISRVFRSKC